MLLTNGTLCILGLFRILICIDWSDETVITEVKSWERGEIRRQRTKTRIN